MTSDAVKRIRENLNVIINILDTESFDDISSEDYLILENVGHEVTWLLDTLDQMEGK